MSQIEDIESSNVEENEKRFDFIFWFLSMIMTLMFGFMVGVIWGKEILGFILGKYII